MKRTTKSWLRLRQGDVLFPVEKPLVTSGEELSLVLSPTGRVLAREDGQSDHVTLPPEDTRHVKNNLVVHNHPQQCSFSAMDLYSAIAWEPSEMRLVSQEDGTTYLYRLIRPTQGWSAILKTMTPQQLQHIYDTLYAETIPDEPLAERTHATVKALAKMIGAAYRRVRI